MMKRAMAAFLAALLFLTGMAACGRNEVRPEMPELKVVPGTLMAVSYSSGSGSMARQDFEIRLSRNEIEYACFWPCDTNSEDMSEIQHIPVDPQQWAEVESVILSMYRNLEEFVPAPAPELSDDLLILDGGDYSDLSLTWESDGVSVQKQYLWPGDRRVLTLTALLEELVDPCGREIVWYDEPVLDRIYIRREYPLNHKKDYSFQFHLADYDPDEEAYRELIYYLGKLGSVDSGRLRLDDGAWEAFLALAETTMLEYFPEAVKSDKCFRCTLYSSDGSYKDTVLNEETEELLISFFKELITQP